MIPSLQCSHKNDPGYCRHQLCENSGTPYTVRAKQYRQEEYSPKLKYKCP